MFTSRSRAPLSSVPALTRSNLNVEFPKRNVINPRLSLHSNRAIFLRKASSSSSHNLRASYLFFFSRRRGGFCLEPSCSVPQIIFNLRWKTCGALKQPRFHNSSELASRMLCTRKEATMKKGERHASFKRTHAPFFFFFLTAHTFNCFSSTPLCSHQDGSSRFHTQVESWGANRRRRCRLI